MAARGEGLDDYDIMLIENVWAPGNSDAQDVLKALIRRIDLIDEGILGGKGYYLGLIQSIDITGARITNLFENVCQDSMVRFMAILRGVDTGHANASDILNIADDPSAAPSDINFTTLLSDVRSDSPAFAPTDLFPVVD